MMISDLCCEAQLQQTHTHPPIHRKRTRSCSQHAGSAPLRGWNEASATARLRAQTPPDRCHLPQSTGLQLWQRRHTQKQGRLRYTPLLLFSVFPQRFLWVYMSGGRKEAQQRSLAGFYIMKASPKLLFIIKKSPSVKDTL